MWSSWTEKATKGFTEALEKTGEAISQAEKKASKGFTEAFEKTGEAITQVATKAKPRTTQTEDSAGEKGDASDTNENEKQKRTIPGSNLQMSHMNIPNMNVSIPNIDKEKVFKNIQMGWTSVLETTKRTVDATREVVETEKIRLEHGFLGRKGFYKRDPKLPLDVGALRDAEVVYITDRIITMSHPAMASSTQPNITAERKLAAIGHLLQRRHDGRFLVWNLSEVEYDISVLNDQVLTFTFPGSPSPPLGLLLKLLVSMENWMKADDRNVAVVHCLTGKGRTSTVLAAFLCWMGEAGFSDTNQALAYIAKCKQMRPNDLTIPSQRRYVSYFKNMLDGVRPSQPPLLLKRIIMSEAPKFAKGPQRENVEATEDADETKLMGCAPYLQIFKAGKLIFTTAATLHVQQDEEELPFVQVMDGTVPFNIEQVIQGDVLIRCRHLTFDKQRVSMFRAAFHTGYVPPNVLRLTKSQLDGACKDKRYPNDFFLDLIFEKVDTETATKHLEEQQEGEEHETAEDGDEKKGKGPVVRASGYDTMLHGDSRFWDVIATRRQEQVKQKDENPLWGRTVGRRRGEHPKRGPEEKNSKDTVPKEKSQLETFSIGNEFDFLPDPAPSPAAADEPRKDSLMEALNALDEDEGQVPEKVETEEVVFDAIVGGKDEASNKIFEEIPNPPTQQTATDDLPQSSETLESAKSPPPSQNGNEDSLEEIDDMDALLASADEDLGDLDLGDFDMDDDLEDLENMLKT